MDGTTPPVYQATGAGMVVLRFFVNAVILAAELAAIVGAAWLGYHHPVLLALLTALIAFGIGLHLDRARLAHDYPFYFEGSVAPSAGLLTLVATGDALLKALLGGLVALLTFSGTDLDRRFWTAVVFGVAIFAGSSLLRRLSRSLDARPSRWGYFRLSVPLGFVFSCGVALLAWIGEVKIATLSEIGRQIVFELPQKPTVDQISELLFGLRQYIDGVVASLLSTVLPVDWAQIASLALSVNVLTGFVAAIYAVVIAEAVQTLERGARV
ncbi:MAG: hypothetical protein NW217_12320 [Hyphomicrobiaceae bacterium]|nr:hypothetical protein [Hyphomicrobiaceae bacterium]